MSVYLCVCVRVRVCACMCVCVCLFSSFRACTTEHTYVDEHHCNAMHVMAPQAQLYGMFYMLHVHVCAVLLIAL